LESCHEDFKKLLKTERLYLFDKRYNIYYNDNNEISGLFFDAEKDSVPRNFYSDKVNVQINAIVGGNGSGKSALAELFLYFMFYYGINKELISRHLSSSDTSDESKLFKQVQYTQEIRMMRAHLNVELLYIYDDMLHQVILKSNHFEIKVHEQGSNQYSLVKQIPFEDFTLPFYSMYVNYSHYGLNTNVDGAWLGTLFHKNDGYQLPVVINPYREEGNININVENYLSRDRVFTNVIDTADESLILPNLEIDFIEIVLDDSKNIPDNATYEKRSKAMERLVEPLYKFFFNVDNYIQSLDYYKSKVEKYLLRKIRTITERYVDYKKYNNLVNQLISDSVVDDDELKSFFQQLYQDRSHVTLKIRQSLNFLRNDLYQINHDKGSKHFKLHEIIKSIDKLRGDQFFTETIDYLPPPIFMTRFHFKNKSHFDQLSSGEKQQIYSIHSIIYHLKNIDSVYNSVGDKLKYDSVFFILDEIELYYHPQAQKKTIDRLLYVLEKSKLSYVKYLNVMFLTHSPFILSDIPSEFTLKLKEGEIFAGEKKHKTFAANITDLLTDSFFLENGLMGDFAKRKIDEVIAFLNYKILSHEINQLDILLKTESEKKNRTKELELQYKQSLLDDIADYGKEEFSDEYIEKLIKMIDEPLLSHGVEQLFKKAKFYLN
jgi:hypothetical protein